MAEEQDKPKIHIDTDWKAQAQAEKERLAQEAEQKKAAEPPSSPQGSRPGEPRRPGAPPGAEPPPADFQTLLSGMVTQALLYMGAIPDPQTGQGIIHLDLARHYIDLLGVLEAKTKGNLTEDETRVLTQALHELRLSYLQLSKQVTEHLRKQAEAQAKGGPGAGPGPGMRGPIVSG